jgi:hypothetical protein
MLSKQIKEQIESMKGILAIAEAMERESANIQANLNKMSSLFAPTKPAVRAEKIKDVDTSDMNEWDPSSTAEKLLDLPNVETRGIPGVVNILNGSLKR